MTKKSKVIGCGSYLPAKTVSNDDLSRIMDTNDEWIRERSGVRQRHIAAEGEYTSHMAQRAAQAALDNAGLKATDIDLILLATSTPDNTFPATAVKVQHALGTKAVALDIQAVCSGFLYGLAVADAMLARTILPAMRYALVIGADSYSRILDWQDRSTAVLFGDGAGAVILEYTDEENVGIERIRLYADGSDHDALYVDGGPSTTQKAGLLRMNGKQIYRKAVTHLTSASQKVLEDEHYESSDVRWLIPHQANRRIMDKVAANLNIPQDRLVVTVDKHANTSAASIPLALDVYNQRGQFKRGDLLLLNAIGGGLTWGAALIRW